MAADATAVEREPAAGQKAGRRITPPPTVEQEIVVLDYGGQYSQLIARRIRDCGVFSELLPHHVPIEVLAARKPRGIVLSGGPASVYADGAPALDERLLELGVPVMGICYGMQLLVHTLGGRVEQADVGEFGRSELHVSEPGVLMEGLPREQTCWMSHRDTVYEPPPGFTALASSTASPVAAVQDTARGIYGIQFHPEVVHTPYGQEILTRFLTDVCGCERNWSAASIVEEQVRRIREQVGEGKVICGLSGGGTGAATIKSHHNVGGLPDDLQFELVEPLRALFKDEVRAVGAELGLPERLVWRQPFPGPGLAIRVVGGEATRERLDVLREADHILQDEIRKAGLYRELWQSFCVLPDVRTVGVQGDERTYGYVVVLRAVTSDDAMTADWARLPYDLLETIASRMINELREVNRVVLDITSKPPGTIEWE
jgi:GMP synthase (glutamine-hydrolysing) A subunit